MATQDLRAKDLQWNIRRNEDGTYPTDHVKFALLMDIRDELKKLNSLLHCSNFVEIPSTLRGIRRALRRPKRSRK